MAVRLFRSNETGAPELGKTSAGDLLTVLRACLVDGFGSRTPAGWTMPFSDLPNKQACFKSVTGDTLRLDDNLEYRFASVLGFKEMTGLDIGTEQYPSPEDIQEGYAYRVMKRETTDDNSYGSWAVIASDNWFYFIGFHRYVNPSNSCGFFFGEYEAFNPSFTGNNMLGGYLQPKTSTSVGYGGYPLYTQGLFNYARRNYQNLLTPIKMYHRFSANSYKQPNPFTGSVELEKPILITEDTEAIRMGHFPNHFHVYGSNSQGYRGGEMLDIDAKTYIVIASTSAAFLIEYDQYVN